MLVLDVADDLLQHVLDGHQACHAAVFVDDDGHVVVVGAKLAQQHVQALGLGHEGGRAQQVLDVEAVAVLLEDQRQQVLGQQYAKHVVVALADHRVARMRGVDHCRQELARGLRRLDADHLRARHHDVAHLQVGDLDRTFDDGQGLAVEQLVLVRFAQQLEELLAVFRLMGKSL
uniref:NAD-specific glutamate dehydrogenase n=1 Tax=Steinernema glaseri TaxID=37863 RepID=A0A1I8A2A8_9BILA